MLGRYIHQLGGSFGFHHYIIILFQRRCDNTVDSRRIEIFRSTPIQIGTQTSSRRLSLPTSPARYCVYYVLSSSSGLGLTTAVLKTLAFINIYITTVWTRKETIPRQIYWLNIYTTINYFNIVFFIFEFTVKVVVNQKINYTCYYF